LRPGNTYFQSTHYAFSQLGISASRFGQIVASFSGRRLIGQMGWHALGGKGEHAKRAWLGRGRGSLVAALPARAGWRDDFQVLRVARRARRRGLRRARLEPFRAYRRIVWPAGKSSPPPL
jgi:hypothetical protein